MSLAQLRGELLLEAKAALPHGEWGRLVEEELPFNRKYAHRLMAVAENKTISNVQYTGQLPSSPETLYHLSRLDDDTLSTASPTPAQMRAISLPLAIARPAAFDTYRALRR